MTHEEYVLFKKLHAEITERAKILGTLDYPKAHFVEIQITEEGKIDAYYKEGSSCGCCPDEEYYIRMTKELLCEDGYLETYKREIERQEKEKEEQQQRRLKEMRLRQTEEEKKLFEKLKQKYGG